MTQRKRLGLTVPLVLYNKMVQKAEYQGKTINSVCLEIFWSYFENKATIPQTTREPEERN